MLHGEGLQDMEVGCRRLAWTIGAVCVVMLLIVVAAWLGRAVYSIRLPDLYLANCERQARAKRATIDARLRAERLSDIPGDQQTRYSIAWHGSAPQPRRARWVRRFSLGESPGQPSMLVVRSANQLTHTASGSPV